VTHGPLAARSRLALTEGELISWGVRFGEQANPPIVVTLKGDLGTGKTTLARAICEGYGVRDDVTSPTFSIVHEYAAAKSPVFHLDLYRLSGPQDLQNIGWDELVQAHALVLIEWPERAGALVPRLHVPIELQIVDGDDTRRILYAGGDVGYGVVAQ
jgi:tRNA threonylcarbamoyladenosine biosynthesis protein TsaE